MMVVVRERVVVVAVGGWMSPADVALEVDRTIVLIPWPMRVSMMTMMMISFS